MSTKPRLPIGDILHRGIVYSLVGLSVWGIVTMGRVHFDKIRRGQGACLYIAESLILG